MDRGVVLRRCGLSVFGLLTAAALAGDRPDARAEVARCLSRYGKLRSYRCVLKVGFGRRIASAGQVTEARFRLSLAAPNRLAFAPVSPARLPSTVCDGKRLWQALPSRQVYVEADAPEDWDGVALDVRDLGRVSPMLACLSLRLFSAQGRRALLGEARDIKWVGQGPALGEELRQARLVYPSKGAILDIWISAKDGLIRRLRMDVSAAVAREYRIPLAGARVALVEEHVDAAVNEKPRDSDFRFDPPKGWRKVNELGSQGALGETIGRVPEVVLWTAGGHMLRLPERSGGAVVLLFWRPGGLTGGLALDVMDLARRRCAGRGARFFAVAVGRDPRVARPDRPADPCVALFERRGYSVPLTFDPKGMAATSYGARNLPLIAVVDVRRGRVKRFSGAALGVRRRLRRALKGTLNPPRTRKK